MIRVLDHNDILSRLEIQSFRREGDQSYTDLKQREALYFLKCDCGHHDFRAGSGINSYDCDGCGMETHVINAPYIRPEKED